MVTFIIIRIKGGMRYGSCGMFARFSVASYSSCGVDYCASNCFALSDLWWWQRRIKGTEKDDEEIISCWALGIGQRDVPQGFGGLRPPLPREGWTGSLADNNVGRI